eukprot:scaffold36260_cov250-Skeletonema_dohrnii-CCMP3373.AAC.1
MPLYQEATKLANATGQEAREILRKSFLKETMKMKQTALRNEEINQLKLGWEWPKTSQREKDAKAACNPSQRKVIVCKPEYYLVSGSGLSFVL